MGSGNGYESRNACTLRIFMPSVSASCNDARMSTGSPMLASNLLRLRDSSRVFSVLLLVVIAVQLCVLVATALRKPFWFDEMLTWHVSGLDSFSRILEALRAGVDGMPPAYYAAVRLARMFPIDEQITLRLPSLIGYFLTLAGVY